MAHCVNAAGTAKINTSHTTVFDILGGISNLGFLIPPTNSYPFALPLIMDQKESPCQSGIAVPQIKTEPGTSFAAPTIKTEPGLPLPPSGAVTVKQGAIQKLKFWLEFQIEKSVEIWHEISCTK